MYDSLTTALDLHKSGDLAQAAHLYQSILAHEPEQPDALHLLGVVALQQGNLRKAVELIGRAVAVNPSVPAFHGNLAEAYRAQGQLSPCRGLRSPGAAVATGQRRGGQLAGRGAPGPR
jgi:Flp pilus assembly protein TadD